MPLNNPSVGIVNSVDGPDGARRTKMTKMTKMQISAKIAAIRHQLAIDREQQLPGLRKAIERAWTSGDAVLAERLSPLEPLLEATIRAAEAELKLLNHVSDGPFDLKIAKSVRILAKVGQAVVTLAGPNGTTVQRHVHLKDRRDKFGNSYDGMFATA